jgi:hypothetical protein
MCGITDHGHTCDEYLVLFAKSGMPVTWEDYYILPKRFPSATAWGPGGSGGGGRKCHYMCNGGDGH